MDTEGTFNPKRIRSIAQKREINEDTVLSNITVVRVENSEWQASAIEQIDSLFSKHPEYKLLVIDSILTRFVIDYPVFFN